MQAPNHNIFWAKTFVDELARCGLEAVCIAPGSRSTPLVIAFAENPTIKVYSHIDERSAAFFALGLAQASGKPVALLCSSGTATANFHPAVIEARYANVPLLVLTADRPHELRESGANQTVDQVRMFGTHVLWSYDVALPEANPPAVAVRNLRTLACRAYAKAMGFEKAPVHLNFPFRKPLEPVPVAGETFDLLPTDLPPATLMLQGELHPSPDTLRFLSGIVNEYPRGIIVCGPRSSGGDFAAALAAFSQAAGYPIFADAVSGVRFNTAVQAISGYDTFLTQETVFAPPDVVIHFGAMPASSTLEKYLSAITPVHRILVTVTGMWTDAHHQLTAVLHADPTAVCQGITVNRAVDTIWVEQIKHAEQITWATLQPKLNQTLFDGSAVAATVAELPANTHLFVASSLPVRHLEQYAATRSKDIHVYANRGASGIDGTISSALGVAAAYPDAPTVLIIGDLAFYHDMNGLLAVKRADIRNITIVLINNDGGGIFHRLPIAQFDPPFTELFLTLHGLDFEPAVRMYGLAYHHVENLEDLRQQVREAIARNTPSVIEVKTNSIEDFQRRNTINELVAARFG